MQKPGLRIIGALPTFTFGMTAAINSCPGIRPPPPPQLAASDKLLPAWSPCEAAPRLPTEVKELLDRTFPGWQFPPITADVQRNLREDEADNARPEVITGDFDGDTQIDYAVIIDYWMAANAQHPPVGAAVSQSCLVLAFLKRDVGYEMCCFGHGTEYLRFVKKGELAYDFEQRQYFNYPENAIFAGNFEERGTSYVYTNGSFRAILTRCQDCPAPASF